MKQIIVIGRNFSHNCYRLTVIANCIVWDHYFGWVGSLNDWNFFKHSKLGWTCENRELHDFCLVENQGVISEIIWATIWGEQVQPWPISCRPAQIINWLYISHIFSHALFLYLHSSSRLQIPLSHSCYLQLSLALLNSLFPILAKEMFILILCRWFARNHGISPIMICVDCMHASCQMAKSQANKRRSDFQIWKCWLKELSLFDLTCKSGNVDFKRTTVFYEITSHYAILKATCMTKQKYVQPNQRKP